VNKSRFSGLAGALKEKGKPAAAVPGRKVAKSKDKENYVQTTAYIQKPLHKDLQGALAHADMEYSQLVEDLLVEWIKTRKRPDV
jgi:hypothetical protein